MHGHLVRCVVLHGAEAFSLVRIPGLICPGVSRRQDSPASVRCTGLYKGGASSSQTWGAKRSQGHFAVTDLEVLDEIRSHVRVI